MQYKLINKKFESILNDDILDEILWYNNISNNYEYKALMTNDFPFNFENFDAFVNKINAHKNDVVTVIGDYDCDGCCATALMMKFLRKLNIKSEFIIGDRIKDGYGMNNNLIDKAINKNTKLIITVDNGIKCKESVDYALSKGIDVIVTDHHQVENALLPNTCIYNPHHENKHLNFKDICGAFVAFVLIYNYSKSSERLCDFDKEFLTEGYELSALATIGDVMPLTNINRKIVTFLIKQINTNHLVNKGIKSLLNTLKISNVTAKDLAFKIVPIINAAGRLDSSEIVCELLLDNENINECISLNEKRKQLTKEYSQQLKTNSNCKVNICFIEDINEGIIGILAGILKEKTNKPSFVFTSDIDGSIKGSGRSIDGYNILIESEKVFSQNDIVLKYGGHEGAIGLTIKDIQSLKTFDDEINKNFNLEVKEPVIDCLEYHYSSFKDVYEKIHSLEPFGQAFTLPYYYIKGTPINIKIIKDIHSSFQLIVNSITYDFMCFNKVITNECEFVFEIEKSYFNNRCYYKGYVKN